MKISLKQPYKQFFGTLANQIRIEIIESLSDGSKNVSEISRSIKREQSSVSHSLKRLELCGFVTVEQNGKERVYSLNQSTIKPLLNLMHSHMDKYCRHVHKEHNHG